MKASEFKELHPTTQLDIAIQKFESFKFTIKAKGTLSDLPPRMHEIATFISERKENFTSSDFLKLFRLLAEPIRPQEETSWPGDPTPSGYEITNQLYDTMIKCAIDYFLNFTSHRSDLSKWAMFMSNAADLVTIAHQIYTDHAKDAERFIWRLDAAVRDVVPDRIFKYIDFREAENPGILDFVFDADGTPSGYRKLLLMRATVYTADLLEFMGVPPKVREILLFDRDKNTGLAMSELIPGKIAELRELDPKKI